MKKGGKNTILESYFINLEGTFYGLDYMLGEKIKIHE